MQPAERRLAVHRALESVGNIDTATRPIEAAAQVPSPRREDLPA
jgi:hypothetical protein